MSDASQYLQRMYYYTGESLSAEDFIIEQQYFRDQFLTLYCYYFSPGVAGLSPPPTSVEYRLVPGPRPGVRPALTSGPVSFALTLVSQAPPPAPQDDNYILVDPGLAVNSKGQQIALFVPGPVTNQLFQSITTAQAYLTVEYSQTVPDESNPRYIEAPKFQAFEVPTGESDPPYGPDQFYLGTVDLEQGQTAIAITGVTIDDSLRQYSRPYMSGVGAFDAKRDSSIDSVQKEITAATSDLQNEIAGLKERLKQLEGKIGGDS